MFPICDRTIHPGHKVDKNSHVITIHRNFGVLMEFVRRFIFLPLFLAFSVAGFICHAGSFFSSPTAEVSLFEENGKVGLKNTRGEILIPASYEALGWSDGTLSIIQNVTGFKLKGEWGLINLNNHKVTKAEYATLAPGSPSLIIARKKFPNSFRLLTGCINAAGKIQIPFLYDGIRIAGLRAVVFQKTGRDLRFGLCDLDHRMLIPVQHHNIYLLGSLRYAVVSKDGKTAIFGEDGGKVTDFIIDSISSFKKNFAIIFNNNQQGVINRDGQILIDPVYRELQISEDGKYRRRKSDGWQFISGENKTLQQIEADSVTPIFANLYELRTADQSRLVSLNLQPVSETYQDIRRLSDTKAVVMRSKKCGVLSSAGKTIIDPGYLSIVPDRNFFRAAKIADNRSYWSLIDSTGKLLTQKNYEFIGQFNGAFFPAKNKNFWGGVDENGREIIACTHDSILQSLDRYVVVKFKGGFGIIDTDEHWIVTPQRNRLQLISGGRYLEETSNNTFIKKMNGDIIYFTSNPIEVKPDFILEFLPNGTIWKIDQKGVVTNHDTAPTNIQKIFPESEGYRAIRKDGRYGFVDSRLRLRIANRYEDVKPFSEGLAAARILGKWGFINKEDNIAIQPVYDEVNSFVHGTAIVKKNNLYGLIDKKGKVLIPVRYESITLTKGNHMLISLNGSFGLVDLHGKIMLNAKYQLLDDLGNGYIIVLQNGKYGVVNLEGMTTIPLIYDHIAVDRYSDRFLAMKKAEWEEGNL